MAYTTINNPHQYFQSVLWTANGTNPRTITFGGSVDIQPDLLWYKCRSAAVPNILNDSVRGFGNDKELSSNDATAAGGQSSETDGFVSAATSDGFTLAAGSSGGDHYTNEGSRTFVAWGWKESATAGFDILTHTGTGSSNDVSHNLSAVPEIIFTKRTSATQGWFTFTKTSGSQKAVFLESTGAESTQASAYDALPTSSVINYGSDNGVNGNGDDYVAYLWRSVKGFSKYGSYLGNGNSNGPFIYTGFQPAWVLIRNISSVEGWHIFDNKRNGHNSDNTRLYPHSNEAEGDSSHTVDMLSNGFKVKSSTEGLNKNNDTIIYLAFAEQPLVNSSGIPGNAK